MSIEYYVAQTILDCIIVFFLVLGAKNYKKNNYGKMFMYIGAILLTGLAGFIFSLVHAGYNMPSTISFFVLVGSLFVLGFGWVIAFEQNEFTEPKK